MNAKDLNGSWHRIEFLQRKLKCLPKENAVYALTNFGGGIIYIGKSNSLRRRIGEHLKNPFKKRMTPIGRVYWVYYATCKSHDEFRLENGILNSYVLKHGVLPPFNKINPPV